MTARWETVYREGRRLSRTAWVWKAGVTTPGPKRTWLDGRKVVAGTARTERAARRALAKAVAS